MRSLTARLVPGLALLLAMAGAAGANWRDAASDHDIARLSQLDAVRARGLVQAHAGAGQGDARAIDALLSGPRHAVDANALAGNWRCRQIELGGMTPYIVFAWFHCRIARVGDGFTFEKLDGSQRSYGRLMPDQGGFVYLGASSARGEKPHAYSGRRQSLGADAAPDDQIGLLTSIGRDHLRLEMRLPAQESDFDVIELKR